MAQTITSKGTALVQLPALHKDKLVLAKIWEYVKRGRTPWVLDYGAGRPKSWALSGEWIRSVSAEYEAYDPYWADEAHNKRVMAQCYDVVLCSNVLNVVNDDDALEGVILSCVYALLPAGTAFFRVYEGDGTGIPKETSKGFQRNAKTAVYESLIRAALTGTVFHNSARVSRSGRVIRVDYLPEYMKGGVTE